MKLKLQLTENYYGFYEIHFALSTPHFDWREKNTARISFCFFFNMCEVFPRVLRVTSLLVSFSSRSTVLVGTWEITTSTLSISYAHLLMQLFYLNGHWLKTNKSALRWSHLNHNKLKILLDGDRNMILLIRMHYTSLPYIESEKNTVNKTYLFCCKPSEWTTAPRTIW